MRLTISSRKKKSHHKKKYNNILFMVKENSKICLWRRYIGDSDHWKSMYMVIYSNFHIIKLPQKLFNLFSSGRIKMKNI